MTEQTPATKQCRKCQQTLPLLSFAGRQNTCIACNQAQRQKTQERKEQVRLTPELSEKITDAIAAGMSVSEICASSWAPTERQLARWRRSIPEFSAAYEEARSARADARSDRVDQTLRDLRDGKISAADARVIVETELKLAGKENPGRYGDSTQIDVTSAGKALSPVDVTAALNALLAALPATALPAPEPLDVEAMPAPTETLQ